MIWLLAILLQAQPNYRRPDLLLFKVVRVIKDARVIEES